MRGMFAEVRQVLRLSFRHAPGHSMVALLLGPATAVAVAGLAVVQRAVMELQPSSAPVAVATVIVGGAAVFATWLALGRLRAITTGLISERIVPILRGEVLDAVDQRADYDEIHRARYADELELLRRDVPRLADFAWYTYSALAELVGLGASLWLMLSVDLRLAGVVVGIACSLVLSMMAARRTVVEEHALAGLRREERYLHESCVTPDSVQETRAYRAEVALDARATELWSRVAEAQYRAQVRDSLRTTVSMLIVGASLVFGVVLLMDEIAAGRHTTGDLVLLITLTVALRGQLQGTVQELENVARCVSTALAMAHVRSRRGAQHGTVAPARASLIDGIELRDVGYAYPGGERRALDGVDLRIPRGSVLAIVGANGAGKSTLANLLLGIHPPGSGELLVDGEPLDRQGWRRRASGAFQDFMKPPLTLREAIGLGDVDAIDDTARVTAALAGSGGERLLQRLPSGLDSVLAARGGTGLSHGQWQMVALARSAMPTDPVLLVLDEPSSALDAHAEHELFTSFITRGRAEGRRLGTISVVISHRYSAAYLADLVVVVEHGRVVEHGTHAHLLAADGPYRRLFDLQRLAYAGHGES